MISRRRSADPQRPLAAQVPGRTVLPPGLAKVLAAALIALLVSACAMRRSAPQVPPPPEGAPRLILFLVIDQARYDYLERFRPLLRFGLARLLDESVVFTNAFHDHAITTTAPGHATLVTGVYPSRHGIINNWWVDRLEGEMIAAVGEEPSPASLLASTLGDWLKAAYPSSKVFSASGKDRGAVLTSGKAADAAFWTDSDKGRFISSEHYLVQEPEWLVAYHQSLFPDRYFGTAWEPLPEVVAEGASFGLQTLGRGLIDDQFPHAIGGPTAAPDSTFYSRLLGETPFGDAYLADFATALIVAEQLGQDAYPDFLGLAFSALDKVGHDYGPDSPELLDTFLRLDRLIGELLDFVDEQVGLEHTIISLSSDHGVTPLPEILLTQGVEALRFGPEEVLCVQRAHRQIQEKFGRGDWFSRSFYLDREAVKAAGIDLTEIRNEARRLIEGCPGVARIWTAAELEGYDGDDAIRRLYANSFHPVRSPDLLVQVEPHTLVSRRSATTHGTPYAYDRHVPWLLRLPSGQGATVSDTVATVDVAPTVAALTGLTPPSDLDGVDRRPLFESKP